MHVRSNCGALLVALTLTVCRLPAAETFNGECQVRFFVDSTLHAFSGDITNLPLTVLVQTNASGSAVLNTRLEIAPRQLTTHHVKRDEEMDKMFHPDLYPKLVATVSNAPLAEAMLAQTAPGAPAGRLPVWLTFCGVTHEVPATISNQTTVPAGWEFDLTTQISLKAFKLKPAAAMLGMLTVKDNVDVKAHVAIHQGGPTQ
jgi:hypothetical protein